MSIAVIGLGSNVGDSILHVTSAIDEIAKLTNTKVLSQSSLYQTPPFGITDQADFINAVIKIQTSLPPQNLLQALRKIEKSHGRKRHRRWGPRTLDLDILLYDQLTINTPDLTTPHPGFLEREFVLAPFLECVITAKAKESGPVILL